MVHAEITSTVHVQGHHRNTPLQERRNVGGHAPRIRQACPQSLPQKGVHRSQHRSGCCAARETKALGSKRTRIGLESHDVPPQLGDVRIPITLGSTTAPFFMGPKDATDSASRLEAELLHPAHRFPGRHTTTAVILGPLTHIP